MDRRKLLQELIDSRFGGSQAAFARAIKKAPAQVSHWLTGHRALGDAGARHIEMTLGLPQGYFDGKARGTPVLPNTEPGPDIVGRVPLISWVQAGHWSEIVDNFHPGDAEEWLPCPVKHSDRTFVLRVRGESMYNPYGRPSFQEGDLIFVDPERQADHGSFVVVRLDDEQEATFKKLIVEGGKRYLRALNPAWPEPIIEIDDNATICGVVIFKGEKL
jgi:SOS-response transcriptional repressor LexA